MNILVFSWRDPKHPLAGGAEQVMHEHMKGWVNNGHKVTLFSSHFKNGKRNEVLDGVNIIRYGYQYIGVHLAAILWYLFYQKKTYDLVVDQFHGIPFFTPLYCRKPKVAVVQEVASEVWLKNDLPKPINWIVGAVGYITEPIIFQLYKRTKFITGSDSAKKDINRIGIPLNNITIIPHGVIVASPPKNVTKNKINTIIFLGALTKDKGIEEALQAFTILKDKGNFNFWVVGKGSTVYSKKLKKICKESGTEVKFFGYVLQSKKFELLKRAHIMVNPSHLEGWGLVNIEANAMGTPVVAYNSAGLIDSVKDGKTGIICKKNNPENLALETLKIIEDKDKYHLLQKNALKWSKNFSWKESKKQSLELIENLSYSR